MILINLKIMKIIVIRWIIYYFKGYKPARWLHGIWGAALLGEISATICVCRNPYIRFCGRWERRGSLLGCERQHVDGCLPGPFLRKGGNNQNICNNYMFETVRTSNLASLDLGWRATSVTPAVSVGLCPCLKGRVSETDWTLEKRITPWWENSAQ